MICISCFKAIGITYFTSVPSVLPQVAVAQESPTQLSVEVFASETHLELKAEIQVG